MRARRRTIDEWLADLPDDIVAVRVRVGTSKKLATVAVVAVADHADAWASAETPVHRAEDRSDLPDTVELVAGDAGWPTDFRTCRLDSFDAARKPGPSWQQSARKDAVDLDAGASTLQAGAFGAMASALERMAAENTRMVAEARRTMAVLGESLAHREEVTSDLMSEVIRAGQQVNDAESELLASGVQHLIEAESANDPLKEQAVKVLGDLSAMFTGGAPDLDADAVADLLNSRPDLARDLTQDQRVVAAFQRAMRAQAAEAAAKEDSDAKD